MKPGATRQSSSVDHPLGSRLRLPGSRCSLPCRQPITALIGRFPSAVHDRRIRINKSNIFFPAFIQKSVISLTLSILPYDVGRANTKGGGSQKRSALPPKIKEKQVAFLNVEKNLTMLTVFYEFTMANGTTKKGLGDTIAYFDMFYRNVPDNAGLLSWPVWSSWWSIFPTCASPRAI